MPAVTTPTPDYRVKVTLLSGNTAVYDVPRKWVLPPRPDFRCADYDRAHTDIIRYGDHLATLMLGADRAYHWIKVRNGVPDLTFPDDHFDGVPDLGDLLDALEAA